MSEDTRTQVEKAEDALHTFYHTEREGFAMAALAHAALAVLEEMRKPPRPYVVNVSPPSVSVNSPYDQR